MLESRPTSFKEGVFIPRPEVNFKEESRHPVNFQEESGCREVNFKEEELGCRGEALFVL